MSITKIGDVTWCDCWLGGIVELCAPPWRRGQWFSLASRAFSAVCLGCFSHLLTANSSFFIAAYFLAISNLHQYTVICTFQNKYFFCIQRALGSASVRSYRCRGQWFQPFSPTIWPPTRTWEFLGPPLSCSVSALVASLVLPLVGALVWFCCIGVDVFKTKQAVNLQ